MIEIAVKGGLCNRLRAILGYIVEAQRNKCTLVVWWVPSAVCNCLWSDLFEDSNLFVLQEGRNLTYPQHLTPVHNRPPHIKDSEIGSVIAATCILRTNLQERVCALLDQLGTDFVALHIRRTDHNDSYEDDEAYADFSCTCHPERSIFLATDNPRTYKTIQERTSSVTKMISGATFSDNDSGMRCTPLQDARVHVWRFGRATTVEDAVVDLWTAARSSSFAGTYYSSFSVWIEILRRYVLQKEEKGVHYRNKSFQTINLT